jgi:uncharacterized protein with ParB-like and HNH nuclease domain
MKPSIQTLGHILYSPSQYVVPVFQRNYRWEKPQWEKLWENLIEIQGADKVGNHFMGFLVFVPGLPQPGQNTTFYLIDGQQRLTTASILLAAVRNVANNAGQPELTQEVNDYYLIHPLKRGEQRYRVLPKDSDRDSFLAVVNGEPLANGRIGDALAFFEDQIASYCDSDEARLRRVFNTVCQRFEFMCATLETENAYSIFKSLNSTGVPLGASDLIRNFVFMHLRPEDQDDFDKRLWRPLEERFARDDGTLDEYFLSRFFRDFLMSIDGIGYVPLNATFERFEARYEATDFSPRDLAVVLTRNAAHYSVISGAVADADSKVTQALARLNDLESSTTYPILLALFERRASGVIDSEQLARAISMLSGFILRRYVCGESSRGYGRMFAGALGNLQDDPLAGLGAYLTQRVWPDDRRFEAAFVEFPLYQRGYAREVLTALERTRGHKEPADLERAQIEHIMPQTLTDAWRQELGKDADHLHSDWLHRPGNLTLSAYNPELLNYPFATKRELYRQSNVSMTRELANYDRWTAEAISERGKKLAAEASQIWSGPPSLPPSSQRATQHDDTSSASSGMSATRQLQLDFWTGFVEELHSTTTWNVRRRPRPDFWFDLPIGRSGFTLETFIAIAKQYIGVTLLITGDDKGSYYNQLYAKRDQIEQEIGESLTWIELPNKKSSYISLYLHNSDPANRELWPMQYAWLIAKLEAFDRAVRDRVRDLTADSPLSS